MINYYNCLRNTYIVDGYEQALEYIEQLESSGKISQKILTNFYCYIIIQAEFKKSQVLQLLSSCLTQKQNNASIRALTLYHMASIHFKSKQFDESVRICQQILQQFIGMYYALETRLQKSQQQLNTAIQLQQILYYVFLMLAYIYRKQGRYHECNQHLEASKRMMKGRADVMSLTSKTTNSTASNSKNNSTPIQEDKRSINKIVTSTF